MKEGELSSADRAFGRSIGGGDQLVEHVAALTSQALSQGHVCLRLFAPEVLGSLESLLSRPFTRADLASALRSHPAVEIASPEVEVTAVPNSAVPSRPRLAFGTPKSARPLVLDSAGRLYLARYYDHEVRLARAVARLLRRRTPSNGPLPARATAGLDQDQARTLVAALAGGLTVVSGGPGTGKTSTVVRILAALFEREQATRGRFPRVLLLAPTGKAAVRLSGAILAAKQRLDAPLEVVRALPDQGSTIHRALGVLPRSRTRFRHGAEAKLDADIVVVDEASMVDLALMRHLLEALPESASLVLLGDRDQLSSVDAGNVLAELCDALEADPGRARGALCQLTQSHRFDAGALSELAAATRAGDVGRLREVLEAGGKSAVIRSPGAGDAVVCDLSMQAFRRILAAPHIAAALEQLGAFRVLCAHRTGPYGVVGLNAAIQAHLLKARLVPAGVEYFHGRPVLITETDPVLELMNGDVGLVWQLPGAAPSVYFERPGRDPLSIAPAHLPGHETAFAMTIHKSQGSEFEHVAVVLPPADSPLASRELLYTAITRARRQVTLVGDPLALEVGLSRQVLRASGLSGAIARHIDIEAGA